MQALALGATTGLSGFARGLQFVPPPQRAAVIEGIVVVARQVPGVSSGVVALVNRVGGAVATRGATVVTVALSAVYLTYEAIK